MEEDKLNDRINETEPVDSEPVEEPAAREDESADYRRRIRERRESREDMRMLARELVAALNESRTAAPPEPTEAEKKAAEAEAKYERKKRSRRRRRRAFGGLLLRIIVLAVVVYVLFFQIIGVTAMPSGDMYPRIDAGDLVLFYRLDKDVRAQDIIVFRKDSGYIQQVVDAHTTPEPTVEPTPEPTLEPTPRPTVRPLSELVDKSAERTDEAVETPAPTLEPTPEPTEAPTPEPTAEPTAAPTPVPAPQFDNSIWGRVQSFFYDISIKLGFRGQSGTQLFVCRVIATAGDTVEITDTGRVVVNGNTMIESNIFSHTEPYEGFIEYPITLQPGECFVLADLRNGGADSRFFGPVSEDEILGTVITIARRNNL